MQRPKLSQQWRMNCFLFIIFSSLLCIRTLDGAQIRLTGCSQSTVEADGHCSRAIDGSTNQDYSRQSCTHTSAEKGWWRARAHQLTHFRQVRIFNRVDCCSERLSDFSIKVDGEVCATHRSNEIFSEKTFQCDKVGQVIQIDNLIATPLTLCEVQVFGEAIDLPSPGKLLSFAGCQQSSTHANGHCQRATDGNTNPDYGASSCIHTNSELGWWQAWTGQMSRVTHVRIFNRLDCCSESLSDFTISVDDKECASYRSGGFFSVQTFQCDAVGQTVRITNRRSTPLMVCEVQVFGESASIPRPVGTQLKLTGCAQSSDHAGGTCDRAIDGGVNQDYQGNSCTHTLAEQGWWQARTHKISNITHVRIYNRLDCCSDRLNDFTISVDGHECASYHSDGFFSVKTFECYVVGQVIRIKNRKSSSLTLCEVQVFGAEISNANMGEHLTLTECSQSSVSHDGACHRAIDGNTNQDYGGRSCIHTAAEMGWWEARTDKLALISNVRIYNRLDCCSDSLTDFAVSVDGHECVSYRSTRFFAVETFVCNKIGQVVRITNRRPTPLMLCEMQVFGTPIDMTIPAKQIRLYGCSQSSTTHDGACDRAIDGIKLQSYSANSCTHTASEKGWWQARTEKTAYIRYVRIYNRLDCCSDRLNDFSVWVGGHECARYQSDGYFSAMTFECNALGQVVRIENHKVAPLTLCEVQVFGDDQPRK